jgi:hypothetical protein
MQTHFIICSLVYFSLFPFPLFHAIFFPMTVTKTVEIPANRRLHLDFEVPFEIPVGRARATLTLTCENEPECRPVGKWVNPLFGLAKEKGAALTVERFIEMQQEEIERENENDRRLWNNK